jgi:hypothetical protein
VSGQREEEVTAWQFRGPHDGIFSLSITELDASAKVGDELNYRIEVTDDSRIEAFKNELTLRVRKPTSGNGGGTKTATSSDWGSGNKGGSSTLQLPNIKEVHEADWPKHGFTELSALKVVNAGSSNGDGNTASTDVFDFFVNVDNKFLRIMQKESKEDPKLLKAKFLYALVLVGLAIIQEDRGTSKPVAEEDVENDAPDVESIVERTTRALAPVLLPMLESIGSLAAATED